MYIQKNLTTSSIEVPGISWRVPPELEPKVFSLGACAKLVLNDDETELLDIVEDSDRRDYLEALAESNRKERAAVEERVSLLKQGTSILLKKFFQFTAGTLTDDEIIQCRSFMDEYDPSVEYTAGEICLVNGIPSRCYDNPEAAVSTASTTTARKARVKVAPTPVVWKPLHGTTPNTALPFINGETYNEGEFVKFNDSICKAVTETSSSPTESPNDWVFVKFLGVLPEAHGAP